MAVVITEPLDPGGTKPEAPKETDPPDKDSFYIWGKYWPTDKTLQLDVAITSILTKKGVVGTGFTFTRYKDPERILVKVLSPTKGFTITHAEVAAELGLKE